jgi:hypothetical protein
VMQYCYQAEESALILPMNRIDRMAG